MFSISSTIILFLYRIKVIIKKKVIYKVINKRKIFVFFIKDSKHEKNIIIIIYKYNHYTKKNYMYMIMNKTLFF